MWIDRPTLRCKVEERGELSPVGHLSSVLSQLIEEGVCTGLHRVDPLGWRVLQQSTHQLDGLGGRTRSEHLWTSEEEEGVLACR